jgi:hypothetical protein
VLQIYDIACPKVIGANRENHRGQSECPVWFAGPVLPHDREPRSSVRDRLRHEGVDMKLGGIDRFTTVADVIDHFLGGSAYSAGPIKPSL